MTWDLSAIVDLWSAVAPNWTGVPVSMQLLELCRIVGLAGGMGAGLWLLLLVVASYWRKR